MTDRLATAQWEPQAEVSRKYPYTFRNFWLGRAEDRTAIGYGDDRHICLVSGSRGGKGTSIIVNNLCYWPGSAVVIDPKGENATVTAARRGQGDQHCDGLGQAVYVLDPFKTATVEARYRASFNPLDMLDPQADETIDEANRLASAIVVKDDKGDQFWAEAALTMVRALILHVVTAPEFTAEERTLLTVRELLKRGDWQTYQLLQERGEAEIDPPQKLLWDGMQLNQAFGGIIASDGASFAAMLANSPKMFDSVLQTALVNTFFLDSPGMREVLARSDFKLSDLKTRCEGMTLYLSLPQRHIGTHFRWLRMMVVLTTTQMEMTRGRPATGYPVLMVLDEFAGLKRMEAIETAVAQIAGFGVKLFFVLQSLEQLKATYKDAWETFLSNAGLKIFFSIEDNFTREYVSKQLGEIEIVRYMQSENASQSENESAAESVSQSHTDGTSTSRTSGTSYSRTQGSSQSVNQSQSTGENWSHGRSESDGTSEGRNWSNSAGSSTSYRKKPFLFFWEVVDPLSLSFSDSRSATQGGSTGTSHSLSHSDSRGGSTGTSRGTTSGTSNGESWGRSQSETFGASTSETAGTSRTTTKGTGRTMGTGRSETIHRRPLLRPEDFGKVLARIDDRQHPAYPGMALVLVAGGDPVVVHRQHYFEDLQFIDCFSPHPDHRFMPAEVASVGEAGPIIHELEAFTDDGRKLCISQVLAQQGQLVSAGQPIAGIANVPPDRRTVHLLAPVTGKLTYVGVSPQNLDGRARYSVPQGTLYRVKYYQPPGPEVDPLGELKAARLLALKQPEKQPEKEPVTKPPLALTQAQDQLAKLSVGLFGLLAIFFLIGREFLTGFELTWSLVLLALFGVWGIIRRGSLIAKFQTNRQRVGKAWLWSLAIIAAITLLVYLVGVKS